MKNSFSSQPVSSFLNQTEALQLSQALVQKMIGGAWAAEDILSALVEDELFCAVLFLDSGGRDLREAAAPSRPVDFTRAIGGMAMGEYADTRDPASCHRERGGEADLAPELWACAREVVMHPGRAACRSPSIFDFENAKGASTYLNRHAERSKWQSFFNERP